MNQTTLNMLLTISILYLIAGCNNSSKHDKDIPVVSVKIERNDIPADSLFDRIEPVYFEQTPESLIRKISKIIRYAGRYILFDQSQQAIMIFDTTGHHLHSVFPTGRGPGEYTFASSFMLDYQTEEIILKGKPDKLLFYDLDGNYLREKQISPCYEITSDTKGNMLIINNLGDKEYLALWKRPFNTKEEIRNLGMPGGHPLTYIPGTGSLATKGVNINISQRFDNCIYTWDGEKLYPRYKIDFGDNNFPAQLAQGPLSEQEFHKHLENKHSIYGMLNIKETPGRIFFQTNYYGLFVLDKEKEKIEYCSSLRSPVYDFAITKYLPIEDTENRLHGGWQTTEQLKAIIKYSSIQDQLPADFKARVEAMEEDANPVLFVMRSKK